jgi:DNA-binding beta-propeller fold protein YncE
VYIADRANNRIRKVTVSTGIITTIAGTGTQSYSGDNGQATAATLNYPSGVALDSAGNETYLYFRTFLLLSGV